MEPLAILRTMDILNIHHQAQPTCRVCHPALPGGHCEASREALQAAGAQGRASRDLVMLPIEIVSANDPFLLRARETFNISKFKTEKRLGVTECEHGLNLDQGQV